MNFELILSVFGLKPHFQLGKSVGTLTRIGLLLPLALLGTLSVQAATYYVATNGNDSWTGLASNYVSGTTGPWRNLGKSSTLVAGDTLYVRGGVYVWLQDVATGINIVSQSGTANNPIVVTNYPNEVPIITTVGNATQHTHWALHLDKVSWIKVFGLVLSNITCGTMLAGVSNCEVGSITVVGQQWDDIWGHLDSYGFNLVASGTTPSVSNYIHNCTIGNLGWWPASSQCGSSDGSDGLRVGYTSTVNGNWDLTSYNLIESNTVYWVAHAPMAIAGQRNVVRGNWVHNEAFFWRNDIQKAAAHRAVEVGGGACVWNVIEDNRFGYAGITPNYGSHGIENDSAGWNIFRRNTLLKSDFSGFTTYGGKFPVGPWPTPGNKSWSNHVYNNTISMNGYQPATQTNYLISKMGSPAGTLCSNPTNWVLSAAQLVDPTYINYITAYTRWKDAVSCANELNSSYKNNLVWGNYRDIIDTDDTGSISANNYVGGADPKFVSSTDGGPLNRSLPNCALQPNSPAIDAGGFLTTITSVSGSGTSFTVADAGYFFAGFTAAGHPVLGDLIQLQGRTTTARITAISGKQLTVNSAMTWTNGQGVGLAYSGAAPDVGAYEYSTPPRWRVFQTN